MFFFFWTLLIHAKGKLADIHELYYGGYEQMLKGDGWDGGRDFHRDVEMVEHESVKKVRNLHGIKMKGEDEKVRDAESSGAVTGHPIPRPSPSLSPWPPSSWEVKNLSEHDDLMIESRSEHDPPIAFVGVGTIIPATGQTNILLPHVVICPMTDVCAKELVISHYLQVDTGRLTAATGSHITISRMSVVELIGSGAALPFIDMGIPVDNNESPKVLTINLTSINAQEVHHVLIQGLSDNCKDWKNSSIFVGDDFDLICEETSLNGASPTQSNYRLIVQAKSGAANVALSGTVKSLILGLAFGSLMVVAMAGVFVFGRYQARVNAVEIEEGQLTLVRSTATLNERLRVSPDRELMEMMEELDKELQGDYDLQRIHEPRRINSGEDKRVRDKRESDGHGRHREYSEREHGDVDEGEYSIDENGVGDEVCGERGLMTTSGRELNPEDSVLSDLVVPLFRDAGPPI
jgi:hypothetical protein